ncbi:MAG: hypothetical protein QOG10_4125 [Kribbellaceae bacterium]|nr:hypothetical protein [Kribbellaceae bacterium]
MPVYVSVAVRREFWVLVREGWSATEAARRYGKSGLSRASASGVGAVPRVNTGSGRPAPRRPTSRLDVPRKLDLPPRLAGLMRELRRVRAAGRAATACRDGKSVIARRVDTGSGRPTPRAGGSSPAGCRDRPAAAGWNHARPRAVGQARPPRAAGPSYEVDLCARLSQPDPESTAERCTERGRGAWNCPRPGLSGAFPSVVH